MQHPCAKSGDMDYTQNNTPIPKISRHGKPLQILHLHRWPDPITDAIGHEPDSHYVEVFWLAIIGPTSTWLLRRANLLLKHSPDGYSLPRQHLAQELGLGHWKGSSSPFLKAIQRCSDFNLMLEQPGGKLYVRQRIPDIPRRMIHKLAPRLKLIHANCLATHPPLSATPPPPPLGISNTRTEQAQIVTQLPERHPAGHKPRLR